MILYNLYRKRIKVTVLLTMLSIWALSSTYMALTKKDEIILIQITDLETKVLEPNSQPPVEIETFINHFVGLFYSYTSQNYEEHMNRAAPLLDRSVLNEFVPKLNKMFDKVLQRNINQFLFIRGIKKIKEKHYELDVFVERFIDKEEKKSEYKLRLKMERVKRTLKNPYGLLITKLEEIYE